MLADNVGYGDIGCFGASEVRGASQGLRLTQYLVEPACTPSRAALINVVTMNASKATTGLWSFQIEALSLPAPANL